MNTTNFLTKRFKKRLLEAVKREVYEGNLKKREIDEVVKEALVDKEKDKVVNNYLENKNKTVENSQKSLFS